MSATKERYRVHGGLRNAIAKVLQRVAPAAIATDEIGLLVALEFALDFEVGPQRARWVKNRLSPTLRKLVEDGLVDREHDPAVFTSEVGRWRWKAQAKGPTLAELREEAEQTGRSATTDPEPEPFAANDIQVKGRRKVRFRL